MSQSAMQPAPDQHALAAYLLGQIDYDLCWALQQRLVYEAGDACQPPATLLVCEHEGLITIGRGGSAGDVDIDPAERSSRRLELRYVGRGGGAVVHLPGQVAFYSVVALARMGWSVGEYVERLHMGLAATLSEFGVVPQRRAGQHGLWGRSGLLVAVGAAVRQETTFHGAFLNVAPASHLVRRVRTDVAAGEPMSSLLAELGRPVKMTSVREAAVRRLAEAFGSGRFHWHGGHRLLDHVRALARRNSLRAG